ncbi:MAG: trigger factor [Oscillospiraceae bacterium]|nr:trigger factor [Oscillospiraceae bacterium]
MSFTYRGLKATLDRHIITDAEVDRSMERLQQQNPRIAVIKDRPTQLGDEVVLDYAGYCDGEQFPGGTAEKQTLVLGSGMFIPGFEEQLVDKVPGEQVLVEVTFPQEYHAENLAGKAATFHCTIHEIRVKTAYELDDVFAKEVGGCDTLEQMREQLRKSLQDYSDERGEMDLQDRLLRMAADTLDFTPSDKQVEAELDNQMDNLQAQLAQQGLTVEMYCQFLSTTREQLREDARATAVQSVKTKAAIEQIVDLEALEATKEEIGEAVAVICRQNNMTLEELKPYYDAEFESAVIRSVLTTKVMKLIRDHAQIN